MTATDLEHELCAREPIHVPGAIQPHGMLLVLDGEGDRILQWSANTRDRLGPTTAIADRPTLGGMLGDRIATRVRAAAEASLSQPMFLDVVEVHGQRYDALLHRHDDRLLLELEEQTASDRHDLNALYSLVRDFVAQLRPLESVDALCQAAAREMQRLTGFGRTLVYRFDREGNGEVLGECVTPGYESYAGHRFPASDIPAQARALYLANHIRIIPDAAYTPSPLVSASPEVNGRPTDLTFAVLRSVSPVHLEYMRNMGTAASMSVSLVVHGALWGLISCHHHEPRRVPFNVRVACEHLGQLLALQIESKETFGEAALGLELRRLLVSLVASVAEGGGALDRLTTSAPDLLQFANASSAAIISDGECYSVGDVPTREELLGLAEWLATRGDEVIACDRLHAEYPPSKHFAADVGGLLAISISQLHRHFVIWFRPEVVRTVDWAGNPYTSLERSEDANRLHPRRSFATWREQVRGRSMPWREIEIRTAGEFRHALLNIVLRRAEEVAALATELGRTNRELEAFSYSVSHDLRAPLRHITGYAELLTDYDGTTMTERSRRFVQNIKDSARFAGMLVDDLLAFSQMGRSTLRPVEVDLRSMTEGIIRNMRLQQTANAVEWVVRDLPRVTVDPVFMQVVLENLLGNAVKYSRQVAQPRVEVFATESANHHVVHVRDNGVGFDMKYVGKLFGIFQRLHRIEEFEGTGIGLASVRRAIERHGGTVSAHGEPGAGATFTFALPRTPASAGDVDHTATHRI